MRQILVECFWRIEFCSRVRHNQSSLVSHDFLSIDQENMPNIFFPIRMYESYDSTGTYFPVHNLGIPCDRATRRTCTSTHPLAPVFPRVNQAVLVTILRGVAARRHVPRAPVFPCVNQAVHVTILRGAAARTLIPRASVFPGVN